ncbi:unnamed protein product, partial [Symbiodinium sp. KB8]
MLLGLRAALSALRARSASCAMAALLELLRWPNFTFDDEVGQGTEGKFGIPRYNGEPTRLSEYVFRVRARMAKEKLLSKEEKEKLGPLGLRLVEGLSGTALRLVQNMGIAELSGDDGVDKLLDLFEKTLKPKRMQQARELYAAGASTHGILSRQPGEPVSTFVLRRRTWYRCLTDCSSEMKLPDLVLAEQLLSASGLSADHQLLIRTAIKGEITFDAVADEMVAQHGRLHERESRRPPKGHGGKTGRSWNSTSTRSWRPSGYMADAGGDMDVDYETPADQDHDGYDEAAYVAYEEEATFEEEQIGFFVEDGVDLDNDDVAESAADLLQIEQGAHKKGTGIRPPAPRQFSVTGSLSLEERKKRVADLKARTTCRRCGQRGHWQGDPHCPQTKGAGRSGKARPGSSTTSPSAPSSSTSGTPTTKGAGKPRKPRPVYFAIREDQPSQEDRVAHLALRRDPRQPPPGADYRAVPPPRDLRQGPLPQRPGGSDQVIDLDSGEESAVTHGSWSLVPAERRPRWHEHEALARAEHRPQWTDLPAPTPGLTEQDLEDMMLHEALGAMEVDTPAAPVPLAATPAPATTARAATPPPRTETTRTPGTTSTTSASGSAPPCQHLRTTTKGSNAFYRQVKCLQCGALLERSKVTATTPTTSPTQPGNTCPHHRVTWRGTNAFAWKKTCLDCGHQESGPTSSRPLPAPTASSSTSSVSGARVEQPRADEEETYLTKEEAEKACDAFQHAVLTKVSAMGPGSYIKGSSIRQSLQLILRMVTVFNEPTEDFDNRSGGTAEGYAPPVRQLPRLPGGQPGREQERRQQLQQRASTLATEGKYKNEPVYHAYQDVGYRNWVHANTDDHSGRGMKQLKVLFLEIADFEKQHGALYEGYGGRVAYMLADNSGADGSESSLVCVLDTGCNTTFHGSHWLERYLDLTRQQAPELLPDQGGGFKGIGGMVRTSGACEIQLCLELADGGYANGSLRSVEICDSEAPLLLSLEAQKRLGLILDLGREIAHSQLLGKDLRLVSHNGLFGLRLLPGDLATAYRAEAEEQPHQDQADDQQDREPHHRERQGDHPDNADGTHDTHDKHDQEPSGMAEGYLAVDQMTQHAMNKAQAAKHREQMEGVKGSDRLLWNQVCPYSSRRRPCLPRGCGTFLLEVLGCAMLTGVAHQQYGYPVSAPIGAAHLMNHDLTTTAGRTAVDAILQHDDPYLTVFVPNCTPWSTWQRVNMGKSDNVDEKVASERKLWTPVLNWMAEVIKDRLRKGRQALLLGPLNSELWDTWAIRGLLSDPGLVDSSTLEPLEKIGFDMCSFGLTGKDNNLYHKKPMGALTTSRAFKEHLSSMGRCRKDHEHEYLAGRDTCRDATFWTPSLCAALLDARLGDLDHSLVRTAFPAEAMEEERLEDVGETDGHTDGTLKLDAVYDAQDLATMVPKGGQIDEQALLDEETPNPELEKEESSQMRERRAKWRALPQATRIAVRRLHTMTGHSSITSMQRLLRTAGGDPDVVRALPHFHCAACAERKKPAQPPATRAPSDYRFNVEVSLDCFEVRDVNRHRYTVLSAVCMGTLFHTAAVVAPDGGVPSSRRCLDAFRTMWLNWAGPPRRIVLDRGTHNRGVFSENMTAMGIELRFVGTEAPYQLGRGERQGAVLKQIVQHVIEARQLDDLASIELLLPEATFVKNNRVHHGGFTPSQWTLGRMPIEVDALTFGGAEQHAAVHEETLEPETEFGKQVQLRMAAKEAFSYVDSAHRIRAAMLRKMTPQRGPFAPGDLVCFYRKSRGSISRGRWMGPARVLGLEGRGMAWLIHGGIPITARVETLRFATGGEIAAKRNLELRPSRKRRRELVDPDEEFEYPFGDDLVGSPVARSAPGEAQQLPFFQADEPDAAYSPDFSPDGEDRLQQPRETDQHRDCHHQARAHQWSSAKSFLLYKKTTEPNQKRLKANDSYVDNLNHRAKELHLHKADPERKEKMLEAAEFRANNPEVDIIPTRTDSPTCSQGMLSYILAFAASRKKPIFGEDITAAFLQGSLLVANMEQEMHRGDSGRAYALTDDSGNLLGMMVSHVDDLLWTGGDAMSAVMEKVQADLKFGSVDEGDFTYCGRKITQEPEGIRVTCPNTAAKVRAIAITGERRKQRDAAATGQEISQLRSVLGSLNWVARVCRPDISYELSALQAVQKQACVQDLLDCNKLLRYVQETPDVGIYYKYGAVDVDRAVVLSITDASYANDNDVAENGIPMGNRSQSGRLLCLANPEFLETGAGDVYLLQHHSNVLRRVCRSTLQAETLSMVAGLEEAEHLRYVIYGMKYKLEGDWKTKAADFTHVHLLTDCRSLEANLLQSGMGTTSDKRLAIDMSALRQLIWRAKGEEFGDPLGCDHLPRDATTKVEWIETHSMPADALTKKMRCDQLRDLMQTGALKIDRSKVLAEFEIPN